MKKEKQLLLDQIKNQVNDSPAFLVASYSKLSAKKANEFRRMMLDVGGNFEIVRKRVFVKACEAVGMKFNLTDLEGHIGIIFAHKDAIDATKAVVGFSAKNDKAFKLLAAKVEGQLLGVDDVARLASLPAKDEMRAQLLGLFEAPMAQTLGAMDALLSSVVYCLDNKAKA